MTDRQLLKYSKQRHYKLPEIEINQFQDFDTAIHSIRVATPEENKKTYEKLKNNRTIKINEVLENPKMKILSKRKVI